MYKINYINILLIQWFLYIGRPTYNFVVNQFQSMANILLVVVLIVEMKKMKTEIK